MTSRLNELAEKSASRNGGNSANYIGANQALRDDLVDYFETKFKIVTQELEKVNEKLNQCQNELKSSHIYEDKLQQEICLLKNSLRICKCKEDKVNDSTEVCLIGSSLLREVRNDDIIKGEVKCLRGGGIDDAKAEISKITSKPKVIITQIGGNDIAKDETTIESTTENYATLLSEVKAKFPESKMVISGLPPRFPTNELRTKISDFNEAIKKWSEENELDFISNQEPFELKTGEVDSSVYIMTGPTPGVHLNRRGTLGLLENIQKKVEEFRLSDECYKIQPVQTGKTNSSSRKLYTEAVTNGKSKMRFKDTNNPVPRHSNDYHETRNASGYTTNHQRGCFNCGLLNHVRAQCRYSQKIRCHRCKLLGHKKNNCRTSLEEDP